MSQQRTATRRRRVLVLAALTVVVATGCGPNFHPGSAAVVDGAPIPQGRVNTMVLAACSYVKQQRLATAGTAPRQSMAILRNSIANSYITFVIDDRAARKLHIDISEAAIARFPTRIPTGVSSSEHETLAAFFHQSTRSRLQEAVIGAHLKNPSVRTAETITPANLQTNVAQARNFLTQFRASQHVVVNPSYGIWSGTSLQPASGSLSDAASHAAKKWLAQRSSGSQVGNLPPSQVCG